MRLVSQTVTLLLHTSTARDRDIPNRRRKCYATLLVPLSCNVVADNNGRVSRCAAAKRYKEAFRQLTSIKFLANSPQGIPQLPYSNLEGLTNSFCVVVLDVVEA